MSVTIPARDSHNAECDDLDLKFASEDDAWACGVQLRHAANHGPHPIQIESQPCAERYKHELVLATCTSDEQTPKRGVLEGLCNGAMSAHIVSRHYSFDLVFRTEYPMLECRDRNGQWEAISEKSEEWKKGDTRS